jgi:hypothetical protein
MQRSLVISPLLSHAAFKAACSLALIALAALLAVACGGGSDKPPLTPDDVTANAMDGGDAPSTTAAPSATPAN